MNNGTSGAVGLGGEEPRMPNTCGMPTCERVSGGPKSSETPPVGLAIKVAAHEGRKRKGWSGAAPVARRRVCRCAAPARGGRGAHSARARLRARSPSISPSTPAFRRRPAAPEMMSRLGRKSHGLRAASVRRGASSERTRLGKRPWRGFDAGSREPRREDAAQRGGPRALAGSGPARSHRIQATKCGPSQTKFEYWQCPRQSTPERHVHRRATTREVARAVARARPPRSSLK